jgi:hypothetical protein
VRFIGQHVAPLVQLDHVQHLVGTVVGVARVGQEAPERVLVAQAPQHRAAQVLEHRQPVNRLLTWKLRASPMRLIS